MLLPARTKKSTLRANGRSGAGGCHVMTVTLDIKPKYCTNNGHKLPVCICDCASLAPCKGFIRYSSPTSILLYHMLQGSACCRWLQCDRIFLACPKSNMCFGSEKKTLEVALSGNDRFVCITPPDPWWHPIRDLRLSCDGRSDVVVRICKDPNVEEEKSSRHGKMNKSLPSSPRQRQWILGADPREPFQELCV